MAMGFWQVRIFLYLLCSSTVNHDTEIRHVGTINFYVDYDFGFVNPVCAAEEYAELCAAAVAEGGPGMCGLIPPPGNCSIFDKPLDEPKGLEPTTVAEELPIPEDCDVPVYVNVTWTVDVAPSYALAMPVPVEMTEAGPLAKWTELLRRLAKPFTLLVMLAYCVCFLCFLIYSIMADNAAMKRVNKMTEARHERLRKLTEWLNETGQRTKLETKKSMEKQARQAERLEDLNKWYSGNVLDAFEGIRKELFKELQMERRINTSRKMLSKFQDIREEARVLRMRVRELAAMFDKVEDMKEAQREHNKQKAELAKVKEEFENECKNVINEQQMRAFFAKQREDFLYSHNRRMEQVEAARGRAMVDLMHWQQRALELEARAVRQ